VGDGAADVAAALDAAAEAEAAALADGAAEAAAVADGAPAEAAPDAGVDAAGAAVPEEFPLSRPPSQYATPATITSTITAAAITGVRFGRGLG